mmetsp:Transcript_71821/g.126845  ORF Transcript_71821/g.126845 Transcript_71821/m.126845 type:complete len:773 (+) Transcript_71821:66-2384(+)
MELVRQPTVGSTSRPNSLPPLPRLISGSDAAVELGEICNRLPGQPIRRSKLAYSGRAQWTQRSRRGGSRPPTDLFRCLDPGLADSKQHLRSVSGLYGGTPRGERQNQALGEARSRKPTASTSTLRAVQAAYGAGSRASSPRNSEVPRAVEIGADAEEKAEARMKQELADMKTGDDAVAFFTRHGRNTDVKLIYCVRQSQSVSAKSHLAVSPYDLMVVTEDHIAKGSEHFTITPNGVVHVMPGELSECTPLAEWVHQTMTYRVLIAIPFFKHYPQRKVLATWSENARHATYCRRRSRLARQCFFSRPTLAGPILRAKELASQVGQSQFFQLPDQCCRLDDFHDAVQTNLFHPDQGMQKELEQVRDALVTTMEDLVTSVSRGSQMLLQPSRGNSRKKGLAQDKQEAKERARKEQLQQEDENSLKNCIRLTDCMLQANLAAAASRAAEELQLRVGGGPSDHKRKMFFVSADLGDQPGEVSLNPSQRTFEKVFDDIYQELIRAAEAVPPVACARPLQLWAEENSYRGQLSGQVLAVDRRWLCYIDSTKSALMAQLREAEHFAREMYEPYRRVQDYWHSWNEAQFARKSHSFESLSNQVSLVVDMQDDLSKFRAQRSAGVVVIEGRDLRDRLMPVPETVLGVVCPLLASTARERCRSTCRRLDHLNKELDERPKESLALQALAKAVEVASDEETTLQAAMDEVQAAHRVLRKQGNRIPLDDQVLLDTLAAKLQEFSNESLPAAKGYLAQHQREMQTKPGVDVVISLEMPMESFFEEH